MSDVLFGALIGFGGTMFGGFFSNFCAEDYRRHRDSAALAGALAGELSSYVEAWPLLEDRLRSFLAHAQAGHTVVLPKVEKPDDRVFDANVGKIGLLGFHLAEQLAYTYNNINAFRVIFKTLMDEPTLTAEEQAARLHSCIEALCRVANRARSLPDALQKFASRPYRPFR